LLSWQIIKVVSEIATKRLQVTVVPARDAALHPTLPGSLSWRCRGGELSSQHTAARDVPSAPILALTAPETTGEASGDKK